MKKTFSPPEAGLGKADLPPMERRFARRMRMFRRGSREVDPSEGNGVIFLSAI